MTQPGNPFVFSPGGSSGSSSGGSSRPPDRAPQRYTDPDGNVRVWDPDNPGDPGQILVPAPARAALPFNDPGSGGYVKSIGGKSLYYDPTTGNYSYGSDEGGWGVLSPAQANQLNSIYPDAPDPRQSPYQRATIGGQVFNWNPITGAYELAINPATGKPFEPSESGGGVTGGSRVVGSSGGGGGGGSSSGVQYAASAMRAQADASNDALAAQAAAEQRAWTAAQNDLDRQLQREKIAADAYAQSQRTGLDAAGAYQQAVQSYDVNALPAFLQAGGGNIANAIAGGNNALSPAAMLPGAQALAMARQAGWMGGADNPYAVQGAPGGYGPFGPSGGGFQAGPDEMAYAAYYRDLQDWKARYADAYKDSQTWAIDTATNKRIPPPGWVDPGQAPTPPQNAAYPQKMKEYEAARAAFMADPKNFTIGADGAQHFDESKAPKPPAGMVTPVSSEAPFWVNNVNLPDDDPRRLFALTLTNGYLPDGTKDPWWAKNIENQRDPTAYVPAGPTISGNVERDPVTGMQTGWGTGYGYSSPNPSWGDVISQGGVNYASPTLSEYLFGGFLPSNKQMADGFPWYGAMDQGLSKRWTDEGVERKPGGISGIGGQGGLSGGQTRYIPPRGAMNFGSAEAYQLGLFRPSAGVSDDVGNLILSPGVAGGLIPNLSHAVSPGTYNAMMTSSQWPGGIGKYQSGSVFEPLGNPSMRVNTRGEVSMLPPPAPGATDPTMPGGNKPVAPEYAEGGNINGFGVVGDGGEEELVYAPHGAQVFNMDQVQANPFLRYLMGGGPPPQVGRHEDGGGIPDIPSFNIYEDPTASSDWSRPVVPQVSTPAPAPAPTYTGVTDRTAAPPPAYTPPSSGATSDSGGVANPIPFNPLPNPTITPNPSPYGGDGAAAAAPAPQQPYTTPGWSSGQVQITPNPAPAPAAQPQQPAPTYTQQQNDWANPGGTFQTYPSSSPVSGQSGGGYSSPGWTGGQVQQQPAPGQPGSPIQPPPDIANNPYALDVWNFRMNANVPDYGVNPYDIGFQNLGPTARRSVFSSMQTKYGIPAADIEDEVTRLMLMGPRRDARNATVAWGY